MATRIGTDTVEIKRVDRLLERHGNHFKQRFFSQPEVDYCVNKSETGAWFARLWSAREAVFKIFGTGNYWQGLTFMPRPMGRLDVTFNSDSFHEQSPVPRHADWDISTDHNGGRAFSVAVCQWSD